MGGIIFMMTNVLVRETNQLVKVPIDSGEKPKVRDIFKERWQTLINLVADIVEVPAGLIMEVSNDHLEVFLKSENDDNPYSISEVEQLGQGFYCETVIGTGEPLRIDNSLELDAWKDNPDVEIGMIAYYGLPLKWSDGTVFGTICALDRKTNHFDRKYRKLLLQFKDLIEQDLSIIEKERRMILESDFDFLTNVYNRRKFSDVLIKKYQEYNENNQLFSLILVDIDGFKLINDNYGHVEGDHVLKRFAQIFVEHKSESDIICRYGGDEFAILSEETNSDVVNKCMSKIKDEILNDPDLKKYRLGFCYGMKTINEEIRKPETLIKKADEALYKHKRIKTA